MTVVQRLLSPDLDVERPLSARSSHPGFDLQLPTKAEIKIFRLV